MFGKKCKKCNTKIKKDFEFCPYCGSNQKSEIINQKNPEKYGLLGKTDLLGLEKEMPFFARFPFRKLVEKLSKDIEKQMKVFDKEIVKEKQEQNTPGGISIQIRMSGPSENLIFPKEIKAIKVNNQKVSKEKQEKYSKLPRKEAETKIRRFANKIVYEVNLPGVKKLEDVFINQLENSIEIKAFSDKKAFFKFIPINLPIKNYKLKDEKLVLELLD